MLPLQWLAQVGLDTAAVLASKFKKLAVCSPMSSFIGLSGQCVAVSNYRLIKPLCSGADVHPLDLTVN